MFSRAVARQFFTKQTSRHFKLTAHAPLTAALTIQDGGQVCPSDADPTNVKGVFWKSVGANFRVRATSPGAIGVFAEISALDLGGKRRFRFGHNCLLICLLSVGRIDVVDAH
jgi:hypothetical protein